MWAADIPAVAGRDEVLDQLDHRVGCLHVSEVTDMGQQLKSGVGARFVRRTSNAQQQTSGPLWLACGRSWPLVQGRSRPASPESAVSGDRVDDCDCFGSTGAVDRDVKGFADFAHPSAGKPAKPANQDRDGDAFHRIQVDRRTARYRVGTRF